MDKPVVLTTLFSKVDMPFPSFVFVAFALQK